MTESQEFLKQAIESAEQKLRTLESEQSTLERQINQTKNEIQGLEKAIASFRELEGQLPAEAE